MKYFVTGGTGFIGRFLLERLLDRGGTVYLLVRRSSLAKVEALRQRLGVGEQQLIAVQGDLLKPLLGVSKTQRESLRGHIDHFVHVAAVYDLQSPAAEQMKANVEGTRQALALAAQLQAGCFQHVSSIAAAGLYEGTFSESMFDQAEHLDHPYYHSKHEAERLVRAEKRLPWRIYRPSIVVGDSRTGEMDKVDGPYLFFEMLRSISSALPSWLHGLSLGGGRLNVVPVDFVVEAMDYLMHLRGQDGSCFHLTHPQEISAGDLVSELLRAAGGPQLNIVNIAGSERVLQMAGKGLGKITPLKKLTSNVLKQLQIPDEVLQFITYPTHFDSSTTQALLQPAGIRCPDFSEYVDVLWLYWENYLRAEPRNGQALLPAFYKAFEETVKSLSPGKLRRAIDGKVVVVTGASSGIGHEVALKLGAAGAIVILAARTVEKLDATCADIEAAGGAAFAYPCDLTDAASCEAFVATVLKRHGRVHVLVNNAGRSIRRAIVHSLDRFHDFERTMQLNYFGALHMIMGFLPSMLEQKSGHIINVSSIGVLASPPRFSAYVASKAALDAFSWCAAAEFSHCNIHFTTINMPLVRTPMIAPTRLYDAFPALTPEQAADLVMKAIVEQPKRIATHLGIAGALLQAVMPNTSEFILNKAYHLFPESAAAMGDGSGNCSEPAQKPLALARQMFAQVMRGVHW